MYDFRVKIVGTSPILLNPATPELLAQLEGAVKQSKGARLTNEQKSQKILDYFENEFGGLGLPSRYITANLVHSGKRVQYSGMTKMTDAKKATLAFSLIDVHMPADRFFRFDPCSAPQLQVDKGVNPNGGEAVVIARPRIDEWGFEFEGTVHDDSTCSPEKLQEWLHYAGTAYGYGDWRPQKGGEYGMFSAQITILRKEKGNSWSSTLVYEDPADDPSNAKPSGKAAKASEPKEGELVGAGVGSNGNGASA